MAEPHLYVRGIGNQVGALAFSRDPGRIRFLTAAEFLRSVGGCSGLRRACEADQVVDADRIVFDGPGSIKVQNLGRERVITLNTAALLCIVRADSKRRDLDWCRSLFNDERDAQDAWDFLCRWALVASGAARAD